MYSVIVCSTQSFSAVLKRRCLLVYYAILPAFRLSTRMLIRVAARTGFCAERKDFGAQQPQEYFACSSNEAWLIAESKDLSNTKSGESSVGSFLVRAGYSLNGFLLLT